MHNFFCFWERLGDSDVFFNYLLLRTLINNINNMTHKIRLKAILYLLIGVIS